MQRRGSSGQPVKGQSANRPKVRNAPTAQVSTADLQEQLDRRTRERDEALEQLAAASQVLQVISSSPGKLEPVFEAMLENAVRICGANFGNLWLREGDAFRIGAMYGALQLSHTDTGAIYVFDEEGKEFRLHATYGMSEAMIAAISDQHIGLGDGNIGLATKQRRPVQVPDIREEPASAVNDIILREGYRGILVVPLLRGEQVVGALVVRRKTLGEFPKSTTELLQTLADQSVVAIQNARLYENVETPRANWRNRWRICAPRRTDWCRRRNWPRLDNSPLASRTRSKTRSISSTISPGCLLN